jgi:MYXO-CTERM domain-containing protein
LAPEASSVNIVGVLASISVVRNTSFQTSRVEAVASMKGTVQLCAPGSTPGVCTPPTPGVPVPIPYPNFNFTSTHTQTDGNSLASLFLRVSIGDDAGTLTGVASRTVLGNAGTVNFGPDDGATTDLFTSTGAFPVKFDIGALVGCSATGCVSAVDASHSLSFAGGAPAFLGLPEGWTVWSEELNIVDNRWIDPRVPTKAPSNGVPAPATAPLVLAGLAAFTARRRRGEQPALLGRSGLSPA